MGCLAINYWSCCYKVMAWLSVKTANHHFNRVDYLIGLQSTPLLVLNNDSTKMTSYRSNYHLSCIVL